MTKDIVLVSICAKYIHSALGLRYLLANLGELEARSELLEFNLGSARSEMVRQITSFNPKIIAFSVHIWNVEETCQLIEEMRRALPQSKIVTGGPEAGYAPDSAEIIELSDYVIQGEGELEFPKLCSSLLGVPGAGVADPQKRIVALPISNLNTLAFPYRYYSEADLKNKLVYFETSRGCPFGCEFCLSSLDPGVRYFDTERVLEELETLIQRGAKKFKFVDRTFNVSRRHAEQILDFFIKRIDQGLFVHFEIVPDRLDPVILEKVKAFPLGMVQFEVGIQTVNAEVAARINRRQDYAKTESNLRFLKEKTQVHLHADLIVGLPGEGLEEFGKGFDWLFALAPHDIQVGILKKLHGTPICRHDVEWGMKYSDTPPYELIQNQLISTEQMNSMKRFSRYWEVFANSHYLEETLRLLWVGASPFQNFFEFSEWLFSQCGKTHSLSLDQRAELLYRFLTEKVGIDSRNVETTLVKDFSKLEGTRLPSFLRLKMRNSL